MWLKTEIWKLQRPLATNEEMPMVLAYTEDKKESHMIPMLDEDIEHLFKDEAKIYVRGHIIKGILHVKARVEEQEW